MCLHGTRKMKKFPKGRFIFHTNVKTNEILKFYDQRTALWHLCRFFVSLFPHWGSAKKTAFHYRLLQGRVNWPSRLCNEWVSRITDHIIKITVQNEIERSILIRFAENYFAENSRFTAFNKITIQEKKVAISHFRVVYESCPFLSACRASC